VRYNRRTFNETEIKIMKNVLLNIVTEQAERMMSRKGVVDYKAIEALVAFHGTMRSANAEEKAAVLWEIGSGYPCKVGEPV